MLLRPTLLFALLFLPMACASTEEWRAVDADQSFGTAWKAFVETGHVSGFRLDEAQTDRGMRVYTSYWRESPAPFRQSARKRLHGRLTRIEEEDQSRVWRVEFWVERQKVSNIAAGFEPVEGDWSDDGHDDASEDIILGQLRSRFGQDIDITPESELMRR